MLKYFVSGVTDAIDATDDIYIHIHDGLEHQ